MSTEPDNPIEAPRPTFSPRRRWICWINLALSGLAVAVLLAGANFLTYRHGSATHLSANLDRELSPRTQEVLKRLDQPVTATVYYIRNESLYVPVVEMLRQYRAINPRLKLDLVDPVSQPGRAKQVQARFKLRPNQRNLVIFSSGPRTRIITRGQLRFGSSGPDLIIARHDYQSAGEGQLGHIVGQVHNTSRFRFTQVRVQFHLVDENKEVLQTVSHVLDAVEPGAKQDFRMPVNAGEATDYLLGDPAVHGKRDTGGRQGQLYIRRRPFKGERLFTSALVAVTGAAPPKVYYLAGHGEHDMADDRRDEGYGRLRAWLEEMNLAPMSLQLASENTVPEDCRLLILAGPRRDLADAELKKLEAYLERGGRLLALLNFTSRGGLTELLTRWGVAVGDNTVLDAENFSNGMLLARDYTEHPVVTSLRDAKLPVVFLYPRTVTATGATGQNVAGAKVIPLVNTSGQGEAVRNYMARGGEPARLIRERQGVLSVAVAVEKEAPKPLAVQGATRMVILGDSHLLDNQMLDVAGNRDLAWHTVNWLLDRSHLLAGIGTRPLNEYQLMVTPRQINVIASLLVGVIPGLILIGGLGVWLVRRY